MQQTFHEEEFLLCTSIENDTLTSVEVLGEKVATEVVEYIMVQGIRVDRIRYTQGHLLSFSSYKFYVLQLYWSLTRRGNHSTCPYYTNDATLPPPVVHLGDTLVSSLGNIVPPKLPNSVRLVLQICCPFDLTCFQQCGYCKSGLDLSA
jgi:hypothetical protein